MNQSSILSEFRTRFQGTKQLKVSFRGKRLQVLIGRCGRPRNLAGVLFG